MSESENVGNNVVVDTPPKEENVVDTPKEEEPKEITKKDPRRVEQGKRLAAISKEAKEKKMRERIREEEFSYLPFIGYGVSILSTFGIFYLLFSANKKEEDIHPMTIIREEKKEVKPRPKKFEGFG